MFRGSDELFENLPSEHNLKDDPHAFDDDSIDKFHRHRPKKIQSLKRKDRTIEKTDSVAHKISKVEHSSFAAFSRASVKYFCSVLSNLSKHQRKVIENFGFESLLRFGYCKIPSKLVKWITRHVDIRTSEIIVKGKLIPFNKHSVHLVLGLPVAGVKLVSNSDSRRIFCCFMVVAHLLYPNLDTHPSPKYLHALADPDNACNLDWSKYIYDWLISSLREFNDNRRPNGRRPRKLAVCSFLLSVLYLDFVDFGLMEIEKSTPRIDVWKGNMLLNYAEYDQVNSFSFGKRPKKDLSSTCYHKVCMSFFPFMVIYGFSYIHYTFLCVSTYFSINTLLRLETNFTMAQKHIHVLRKFALNQALSSLE